MKMMNIKDFSSKELLNCQIVLLGEAKAGKTTLLTSYIINKYTPCYVPTVGGVLYKKIEYFKDLIVLLNLKYGIQLDRKDIVV